MKDYEACIIGADGLSELASTPFVLRVMASALPKLSNRPPPVKAARRSVLVEAPTGATAPAATTVTTMTASRSQIYEVYTVMGWENAKKRLASKRHADLPTNFDEMESFSNYSMDLAVEMLARNQLAVESPTDVYTPGGPESSPWIRFFRNDAVTRNSLSGAGLVCRKRGASCSDASSV